MAYKTKTELLAEIAALPNSITPASLTALLTNMVDSGENLIREFDTTQRDALTPYYGQKIYNTTSNRLEYYSASMWLPCSQKETVAVDCSANPNYPKALVGDQYIVTVAGIIGGGSGKAVSVGDLVYCVAPNAGGTEASVGTSWKVCYSSGSGAQLKKATLTISSADVLTLNGTPKEIVSAVSGKSIQVVSANGKVTFNSVAYDTNAEVEIYCTGAAKIQAKNTNFLAATATTKVSFTIQEGNAASGTQLIDSVALMVKVPSGNPATGDSPITITVFYLEV